MSDRSALLKEKTVEWGGGALVYMCYADATAQRGGEYWSDANSTLGEAAVYSREFCPHTVTSCQLAGIQHTT